MSAPLRAGRRIRRAGQLASVVPGPGFTLHARIQTQLQLVGVRGVRPGSLAWGFFPS